MKYKEGYVSSTGTICLCVLGALTRLLLTPVAVNSCFQASLTCPISYFVRGAKTPEEWKPLHEEQGLRGWGAATQVGN